MIHDNVTFKKQDFTDIIINGTEFDNCVFESCNFTNAILSDKNFIDCKFENCHFSMTKIINSGFQEAEFKNCKILGLDFSACNPYIFRPVFYNCIIDYSNFTSLNLKSIAFSSCQIKETDFSNCDMKNARFEKCDLEGSLFYHTNLEKVCFLASSNYTIDPEENVIKNAEFDLHGLPGLLSKHKIIIKV
jgi:fluoroquinolone resistance protein